MIVIGVLGVFVKINFNIRYKYSEIYNRIKLKCNFINDDIVIIDIWKGFVNFK